ncbi:hypothetical protein HYH03_005061 [Edaphochlamys debaryana]|uniref:Uncharacterized protein n=1 Tax=Edaphochlamys debaryana TaxID=47281 RepID=A0A836C2X1_9CHLO|nr:hypothetical protein HYH03_005061 [Edaphochlamys debaryana]|eukprot:KAG2497064.1 hypothetical protein HYH03_005061 [Edaphochlamys debaryana]
MPRCRLLRSDRPADAQRLKSRPGTGPEAASSPAALRTAAVLLRDGPRQRWTLQRGRGRALARGEEVDEAAREGTLSTALAPRPRHTEASAAAGHCTC